jgi:uncharacterized membrane protein
MLDAMMDSFADPHARHAMLVHWPIVLMPVGLALLLWFAGTGFKRLGVGVAAVLALLGATGGAGLAAGAGEEAYERVEQVTPALNAAEEAALERHESLGEGAWLWPAGCAVLAAGGLIPKPRRLGVAMGLLAIVATLGVSARFAWTAHTGGVLVYEHGLGVPARGQAGPPVIDRARDRDDD